MSDDRERCLEEIETMLWANRWPTARELVEHLYEEYYAPGSFPYTDQDVYEQTRKKARFYAEHGRLPERLGEWAPGWGMTTSRKRRVCVGGTGAFPMAQSAPVHWWNWLKKH